MTVENIYARIPKQLPEELVELLVRHPSFRVERIVSRAHATPDGEWYDQDAEEWVLLLKGAAGLLFEGSAEPIELKPGDYLTIPAHVRHRVAWTAQGQDTVWLALHYPPGEGNRFEKY
jgi:cupin 2 domain-containing protein